MGAEVEADGPRASLRSARGASHSAAARVSVQMGSAEGVATKNSESFEKSRVLRFAAVVSPACMNSCVGSSQFARRLRSRAAVELENLALRHQLHVLRRQRPGRPRLFTIDSLLWIWLYRSGRAVWTRWCWSSPPPSFNGTVKASAYSGVGVRNQDGRQWIARFAI